MLGGVDLAGKPTLAHRPWMQILLRGPQFALSIMAFHSSYFLQLSSMLFAGVWAESAWTFSLTSEAFCALLGQRSQFLAEDCFWDGIDSAARRAASRLLCAPFAV